MEKLLPIKFFEKRKVDEQLTEPGGSGELPKWVLQGKDLSDRSSQLSGGVSRIADRFAERKDEQLELPLIIETTINEKAIAKSHRSSIVDLLNSDSNDNVIGVRSDKKESKHNSDEETSPIKEERKILSVVTSDELIANISRALQDTQNSVKLISSITDVHLFEPVLSQYNPQNRAYRVRLVDYHNTHRNKLARTLFKNKCAEHGILINTETRYSFDMYIYRVTLDEFTQMESVSHFEGVYSIEEAVPIVSDFNFFEGRPVPQVKTPVSGENYPMIGVLDSGIEKNAYLSPWILKENEEYYEKSLQDKGHGSMVASILEYSDEFNGTNKFSTDGIMLFESVIVPDLDKENAYPEDILDNVRDAVERHRDIKVWTMSVGTTEECALDMFSEYGMALDNIADENNVLIIKSAGNTGAFMHGGQERIAKMADSVRSLVVGSVAGEKGTYDFSEIDMPSPFTRIGPGPEYIVKPDLVAYGGNAGKDLYGNMSTTGVRVFGADGKPCRAPGTSFSTPWVARIASELEFLLEGDFDPLLIKALMIHNSGYPAGDKMKMDDKRRCMGFGMPSGTRDILYNSESEITLILRDKLEKGSFINILEFPFAKSLVGNDDLYRGQIIITLVNNALLKSSEGPEYCQSDIKIAFGTMEGIQERDTSKRTIRNQYGPKGNENLLKDDLYSKKFFDILEGETFGRERTLIKYGDKYHPVKKYAIDLSEMKPAHRKKHLVKDNQWYMKITGLFRDSIEREARDTGEILEQDFCMLITIRDPDGKAPVYNEVTQQLNVDGFVYSNVRLKNEIREYVGVEGNE